MSYIDDRGRRKGIKNTHKMEGLVNVNDNWRGGLRIG